jgi:autotransporter-associated beta strand protein
MILSGTNTNTGLVSIQAGVLDFQKAVSLYNNTPGSWTAANIDVKSGATLGLGLGGPGAFASADIDTIRTNLDTATPGQGFESGASLGIDTTGNNATYASTIANPNGGANVLGFVKLGGNTLTLSGPNTYTGPTQITGGALSVASLNSVSGGTASSNLGAPTTVANGTINFFGSSFGNGQLTYTGAGETTDRVLNLSGGGQYTATLDQSGTGLLKFTSDMTFAGASGSKILILQGNTAGTGEFAGAIGNKDANNLTVVRKAGTGTWTLSGANTYTGTTSVNGGILSVASLNSVSGGSASSNLGAPKTVPNGTIAVGSGVTAATLLYTGAGETTDRVINLAGTTGGATIDQSGTGLLKFTSAFTATGGGNKTLTLQGFAAGTGEIAGAIVDNTAVTKITSLTKAGTGTWTLSGANSYTGATNVNEGKLLVNGSLASGSAVTVASTATLGGSGTIGGAVTVQAGGKLAPGTSPGQLTVGSLTLAVDSTTQMEIGGATLGTGYDNVTVTTAGGLTYGGLLDIVSYGIYNVAAQSGSYELFTFTGGYAGDFGTVTVNGFALANTAGVWSGTNGGITYTFTDSTGVLQVVPEPAALALLCLGAVGLLRRRRAG